MRHIVLLVISDPDRLRVASNQIRGHADVIACPTVGVVMEHLRILTHHEPTQRRKYRPGPRHVGVLVDTCVASSCTMQGDFLTHRRPLNSLSVAEMSWNVGLRYLICLSLPPSDEDRRDLEFYCTVRELHYRDIYVPPGPDDRGIPACRWDEACAALWSDDDS